MLISFGGMIWRMICSTWEKPLFRFLDAGAAGRADVEAELAGVDQREKVAPQERNEDHEAQDDEG